MPQKIIFRRISVGVACLNNQRYFPKTEIESQQTDLSLLNNAERGTGAHRDEYLPLG